MIHITVMLHFCTRRGASIKTAARPAAPVLPEAAVGPVAPEAPVLPVLPAGPVVPEDPAQITLVVNLISRLGFNQQRVLHGHD